MSYTLPPSIPGPLHVSQILSGSFAPQSVDSFGGPWATSVDAAEIAPWGWAPLDDTYEIAHVIDSSVRLEDGSPIFASLTYRDALEVASREGARLISPAQVAQLHRQASREPSPVTLPDAEIRAAARLILARRAGETPAQWDQRLRNAGMTSQAWAAHHSKEYFRRLGSLPEPGELVANAGKHWVDGAPAGRAWLMGWWNGSGFIQPLPPPGSHGWHDDGHHDYATTTILVRRRDGLPIPAPPGSATGVGSGSSSSARSSAAGWLVGALALGGGVALAAWYWAENEARIRRRLSI